MRKTIMIAGAAQPIGPYSHAIIANGFIFVSGQGPRNPQTRQIAPDFEGQARQVFTNLKTILEGAGVNLKDVVKVNAYLSNLEHFQVFNTVYREFFPEDFPTRTTVGAALLENYLIEVDVIAVAS